jgi:hypothetical protein
MNIKIILWKSLPFALAIAIGLSVTGLTFFYKSAPVPQNSIGGSLNIRQNGAPIKYYEEFDAIYGSAIDFQPNDSGIFDAPRFIADTLIWSTLVMLLILLVQQLATKKQRTRH